MKFLMDNWMLLAVVWISAGMLLWPVLPKVLGLKSLTAGQVVTLMNQEKAVVIDVSEVAQFASGHIRGAKNVLLGQLQEKLPSLVKNKDLPVIFVCPSGSQATRAVVVARKMGYQQGQSLGGGLKAWKEANLPLSK